MATASLGTKRECTKCGAKFYDLEARPVVCPKCGATQKLDDKPKPAKRIEAVKPKKAIPKAVIKGDDDELEAMEDTSEELEDLDALDDAPEVISLEEVEDHQEEAEVDPNSDDAEDGMFIEELQGDTALFDSLDSESESDEETEESDDEDDPTPARKRKKK